MSDAQLPTVPADLQSRLEAAGVRADDPESLQRALNADPELARDFRALLEANPTLQLNALLNAFLAVPDFTALMEFWQHLPADSEDAFIGIVEQTIAQAEQAGNTELVQALGQRLEGLRQIQTQQQVMVEQVGQWASEIAAASDGQRVGQIWNDIPTELEHAVLSLVEQQIVSWEQAGDHAAASRAQGWLEGLKQIQQQRDELARQPPEVRALLAFLQANDDDAARLVFQERQALLQPYSAQELMNTLAAQAPAALQERFSARATLLRALRGAAPTPPPTEPAAQPQLDAQTPAFSNQHMTVSGDLNQAAGNIYINSAHIEAGGSGVVVNNIYIERRWLRPTAPELLDAAQLIERTHDYQAVLDLLQQQGQVALTSTVQGMAGIGKTVLARQLAQQLDSAYPGGILWQPIGQEMTRDQALGLLNTWARYALQIPTNLNVQFEPGAIRALFSGQGRLLVVLDDVWSTDAIRPLREALPQGTHVLVTTRLQTVVQALGGAKHAHVLGTLSQDEARRLIALRLGWEESIPDSELGWCDQLAEKLGWHVLALDVALRNLPLAGDGPRQWQPAATRIMNWIETGQGFEHLHMPEGDREQHVERILSYSYTQLPAAFQRLFRMLGAFAPEAPLISSDMAALLGQDEAQAEQQLNRLVNLALLSRAGADYWQQARLRDYAPRLHAAAEPVYWHQHALLRGYALALLQREGEYEAAAARHAGVYAQAMQATDDQQRYAAMLPFYPQLRHAFTWAIANDLDRAQGLIASTANLQAAFGLARDALAWAEQALTIAQARGTPGDQARGYGTLGNALQHIATRADEDRAARLRQALAAYDHALRFRTPDTAPLAFATTQNNRGTVLTDLATLADEDRAARLRQALAAYDHALRFRTPDTAPLAFATTQNNRGNVLTDLATLADEDRAARLRQALAAFDHALRFYTPDTAPLDFAMTQNNRGTVLTDLATLADEDRAARLRQALAAFDHALRFRTPDTAPLDFAMTQNNRGTVLTDLATLADEDRAARLRQALAAFDHALRFRTPDTAPLDFAMTQGNLLNLYQQLAELPGDEQRQHRIAALQAGWRAFSIFRALGHGPYQQQAMRQLQGLQQAYGADFAQLWQQALAEPMPEWLLPPSPLMQQFQQALNQYVALHQQAEQDANNPAAWQATVQAGETLLGQEFAELEGVDWAALRAELANDYTSLSIAHEAQHALEASLAATERAIELAPENAMWRRNRTGTLIDLGRLDEAAAELERARALEPEAARLAELAHQLHPDD